MAAVSDASPATNSTARVEKNEVLETLVENLNALGALKPLQAILAPGEDIVRSLHEYADSQAEPDKQLLPKISEGFAEMGTQVAEALRAYRKRTTSGYKGLLQRTANYFKSLLTKLTKKAKEYEDSIADKTFVDLVQYGTSHTKAIKEATETGDEFYSFQAKAQIGRRNITVKVNQPLKLFEYLNLAYKRNLLIGRAVDYKIKGFALLAHCIREDLKAKGKFLADKQKVAEELGLKPRVLSRLALEWNNAIVDPKPSSINDYGRALAPAQIEKRDKVIADHNAAGRHKTDTLKEPNKLMQFLKYTKEMQAIKSFYKNKPAGQKNTNFRSLDIIMQWYIQLGNAQPIISLVDYAKEQHQVIGESPLANIKRDKSKWNNGKFTI